MAKAAGAVLIWAVIIVSAAVLYLTARARRRWWLLGGVLCVVMLWLLAAAVSVLEGAFEEGPDFEDMVFRNESDQMLYLPFDYGTAETAPSSPGGLGSGIRRVPPGRSITLQLDGRWSAGQPLCPQVEMLLVESISGERSYGSVMEIAPGLSRNIVPTADDLRVVGRIPATCRTRDNALLVWDGSRLSEGSLGKPRVVQWWWAGAAAMPAAGWWGNRRRRNLRGAPAV